MASASSISPAPRAFHVYRWRSSRSALAVLAGIVLLAIRRGFVRPAALGATVSKESILIAVFIAALMVTFLLDMRGSTGPASACRSASTGGRTCW